MGRDPEELRRLAALSVTEAHRSYAPFGAFMPPGEQERTSFRLTPGAADARDWLVDHLRIAQRELLDRIPFYLDEAVRTYDPRRLREVLSDLDMEGERKTYVISDSTLGRINEHADRLGVPRDALVSFALLGMQYLVEQGAVAARKRRGRFVAEVDRLAADVRELQLRSAKQLDPEDALQYRLASIAADLEVLAKQLHAEQDGGPTLPHRG